MNIFGGMKILWVFLEGHHKVGQVLVVISMYFKCTEWDIFFFGLKIIQISFGVLDIPDLFWG